MGQWYPSMGGGWLDKDGLRQFLMSIDSGAFAEEITARLRLSNHQPFTTGAWSLIYDVHIVVLHNLLFESEEKCGMRTVNWLANAGIAHF